MAGAPETRGGPAADFPSIDWLRTAFEPEVLAACATDPRWARTFASIERAAPHPRTSLLIALEAIIVQEQTNGLV